MEERKRRILKAIIDDYVQTAEPVGSRTIARKYLSNLSSATIRNEMSDLEELGYLSQPHISAGRVPKVSAYRLYVDHLLSHEPEPVLEEEEIRSKYLAQMSHLEDVVRSTAQALTELTGYTSLVMLPRQADLRITSLQLVPVSTALALLVIVTDGGIIRDTMVRVSSSLDADALYAISRMLTEQFAGRTLQEVQTALTAFADNAPGDPQVLKGILDLAEQIAKQNTEDNLTISGTHNILGFPEYQDAGKARQFLSSLENKERLLELIRQGSNESISVHIGPENGIKEMEDCSVLISQYKLSRGQKGAIGLIGPTRMPYGRMISTLRLISRVMSDVLQAR